MSACTFLFVCLFVVLVCFLVRFICLDFFLFCFSGFVAVLFILFVCFALFVSVPVRNALHVSAAET